jgi:hypothetical protein
MNRNELITYIQMDRGMKMASVKFLDARQEFIAGEIVEGQEYGGREYLYKVRPGAEVSEGDLWAVQARNSYALVVVTKVHITPPAGVDLGAHRWKYLISRVETEAAENILAEEAAVFDQIARIEIKSKMQEITQALGFDVSQVEIPSLSKPKD